MTAANPSPPPATPSDPPLRQYLDGQIDRDLWEAHRAQAQAVNNAPVAKAVWRARREWFTPRYRAFRDAELATAGDTRMTYDHFNALRTPAQPDPQLATPSPNPPAE